jgi:hypothetical protein
MVFPLKFESFWFSSGLRGWFCLTLKDKPWRTLGPSRSPRVGLLFFPLTFTHGQRFRYNWKKFTQFITQLLLETLWIIKMMKKKMKYSWKVFKILVFEYKYSNTLLRIYENWYSNTVFEYLQLYWFGIRIHIRILMYSNIFNSDTK